MYLTVLETKSFASLEDRLGLAYRIAKNRSYYITWNEQLIHSMVCVLAGGVNRKDENLLYLKNGRDASSLMIQSDNHLSEKEVERFGYTIREEIDLDKLLADVKNGSIVFIKAKYAPTKDVNRKKRSIRDQDERMRWVERKLKDAGMVLCAPPLERQEDHILFSHGGKNAERDESEFINGFVYNMAVRVEDCDKFAKAVHEGIGRGKSYGCGMTVFKVRTKEAAS